MTNQTTKRESLRNSMLQYLRCHSFLAIEEGAERPVAKHCVLTVDSEEGIVDVFLELMETEYA